MLKDSPTSPAQEEPPVPTTSQGDFICQPERLQLQSSHLDFYSLGGGEAVRIHRLFTIHGESSGAEQNLAYSICPAYAPSTVPRVKVEESGPSHCLGGRMENWSPVLIGQVSSLVARVDWPGEQLGGTWV
jgi:hypothetical protein